MGGSHAASADAELALLVAGTERRRRQAHARIVELGAAADPSSLIPYLSRRRLLALVGSRLLDVVPTAPIALREAVGTVIDRTRLEAMAIDGVTTRLALRLEERGIATLPVKGPRLAEALHRDSGLRVSHDVDLLVPPERLEQAVAIALTEGYAPPMDARRPDGLPDLHFELSHRRLPSVELHWRVHWYDSGFSQAALGRSEPGDDGLRRPQPVDELAMLLLFYARDGFHGVRYAADIAAWWDLHGRLDAGGILDGHAARHPDLRPGLRAAAVCAQRYAGVPASALVSDTEALERRERVAVALGDWATEEDRDQLAANLGLVDGLLSPPGRTPEFLRRQLLPPASVIVGRRVPSPRGGAALRVRGVHAAKRLVRFGLALLRVRGGRPWRPLPPAAGTDQDASIPAA